MLPVIVFDLSGTLLDLSALDPLFDSAFGEPGVRREWFAELLQLAMTSTITGYFIDFSTLRKAALDVVVARHRTSIGSEEKSEILQTTSQLPLFPDVEPGLHRLRAAGFRLAVLTNSGARSAESALRHAALHQYFERVLSTEVVQRYKPAPEVYRYAAAELGVDPISLLLIAAHSWDTTGAIRAGCDAAFLERPGQVLDPVAPRPRLVAPDLQALAGCLIGMERAA